MTNDQKQAGRDVMRGVFYPEEVMRALLRAGVSIRGLQAATDELLLEEEAARRIRPTESYKWMAI